MARALYHFVGATIDSLRVDGDGNAYAALAGEGRVVVLNPKGAQIGQILIPDRDRGEFPFTISMAIKPGTRERLSRAQGQDLSRWRFRQGRNPARSLRRDMPWRFRWYAYQRLSKYRTKGRVPTPWTM